MFLGMLSCKEALIRLDDYIDRELSPQEEKQVKRHLKICHACKQLYASEAKFVEATRRKLDRLGVPEPLMPEISETLTRLRDDTL